MALVWGAGIKGAGGKAAGADQRFDFTVRKAFAARFECSRVNPQAGCNPVEDAHVRFSAPIAMAKAKAIRHALPDGPAVAPTIDDDDKGDATIADLNFKAPFTTAVPATVALPAAIQDESGRPLSNATRFPQIGRQPGREEG